MQVHLVPCLKDNYAYLVHREGDTRAWVVDASEEAPVVAALERLGLTAVAVLSTHHHQDHVGGNAALSRRYPGLRVFGSEPDRARVPALTDALAPGQAFRAAELEFKALFVPGHTLGALTYVVEDAAFTGDTLFAAGCGRLFEGTAAALYESLNRTLGELPDETKVYCGHEYTLSNLRFAASVEPKNVDVARKLAWADERRARGEPTLPSTLGEERRTNPFLRCGEPAVVAAARDKLGEARDGAAVFGALRAMKDRF